MNNLLPGMFATEGASEMGAYAEAFGIAPEPKSFVSTSSGTIIFRRASWGRRTTWRRWPRCFAAASAFIVGQNIVIDGGRHSSIF
ncbi:MAG: hypothetical protein R3E64_12255 [Halioglobus sp.]